MALRGWALGLSLAALGLAGASCHTSTYDYSDCDYVVRHCRTVCTSWCDYYGCYPDCYDQCWDECGYNPAPPAQPKPPTSASDAGPAPDASASDAGAPPSGGRGVLCSPCGSNDDCQSGALCIQRGGADAGGSFCGLACNAATDCPDQFTCAQIGSAKQCIPLAGGCD